jgi:S-(hydroxymethyl)glutathione dehydrogenase/alcohol dehydrogenase
MKAAILTKINSPLELWDLEHPISCYPGQVFVDINMSGICGSQLQEIAGNKNNAKFIPHLLGHEGSGIVREVGQGVDNKLIGKKVICHWRKGEGLESAVFPKYKSANREAGAGHITTFCEGALISRNRVTVVPDDVPDELCALLGCGLSTALGTVEQEAKLKFGESILVIGCGGLGLNLIQASCLACAYPIIAVDILDEKYKPSIALGAHKYINTKRESIKDAMKLFGLKGFDVVVETSGSIEAIEASIPLLGSGGRYIMVGQPKPSEVFKILGFDMFAGEGRSLIATQGGHFYPHLDIPRYINLWKLGSIDIDSIVSHHIPLNEINKGIELVRAGQAGRIMVVMK